MAIFTENQTTHLYVVTNTDTPNVPGYATGVHVGNGESSVGCEVDLKPSLYIKYTGADGTKMRSDLITNIEYITSKTAEEMRRPLKQIEVQINDAPLSGQDYILNIQIRQYIGGSDEDVQIKTAAVHATADMTTEQFYEKMAASLFMNFAREPWPLIDFYLGGTKVCKVITDTDGKKVAADADGNKIECEEGGTLVLVEAIQDWKLGTMKQTRVYFDVFPSTIYTNGDEVSWGTATTPDEDAAIEDKFIPNGREIADMEWFYMGERGDQYRLKGWPNYVPTTYLVNPNLEYDVATMHYSYIGNNEGSQKSEKDIILVAPTGTVNLVSILTGESSESHD